MSENTIKLRQFIEREMQERSMSAREFARFVGVSSSTISRTMASDNKNEPTLYFLDKLASATHVELCYLVELLYPQPRRGVDPDVARLAESISKLPVEAQEMVDSIILGLSLKSHKENPNVS